MSVDEAALTELVARAQAGDAEAFAELFDHYHGPVYRFISSRVGRPSDAEDLTQTVFVKVLEALPRYESRGVPFGGWLFRLARNTVIDFVRTQRQHQDLEVVASRAHADPPPDAIAEQREQIEAVGEALGALTDEQREVVALRFFAGLTAREAAVAMDKQEGTVRGLQFRAIGALRRQLGIPDPGPGAGSTTTPAAARSSDSSYRAERRNESQT
jgi:RNA polymerase sigma-70 factor (ECF subfamily)